MPSKLIESWWTYLDCFLLQYGIYGDPTQTAWIIWKTAEPITTNTKSAWKGNMYQLYIKLNTMTYNQFRADWMLVICLWGLGYISSLCHILGVLLIRLPHLRCAGHLDGCIWNVLPDKQVVRDWRLCGGVRSDALLDLLLSLIDDTRTANTTQHVQLPQSHVTVENLPVISFRLIFTKPPSLLLFFVLKATQSFIFRVFRIRNKDASVCLWCEVNVHGWWPNTLLSSFPVMDQNLFCVNSSVIKRWIMWILYKRTEKRTLLIHHWWMRSVIIIYHICLGTGQVSVKGLYWIDRLWIHSLVLCVCLSLTHREREHTRR